MPSFPFTAIVGHDTLKRALVLSVIQPSLGGVLIRGTKGVAKSTAVRALAGLLPPIETLAGCPFQRKPGDAIADWPLPAAAAVVLRPVPLVELPLGATEDRVLGSLHLERALRGERSFEPGLLAAANRGILYIDEVNLLPDHLVDILLDAAAGGVHRVEREGLSLTHPARFVLIGTMNPEEGDLRPQLLDRFGLVVDVADLSEPAERAEAVRRRLAFEADPEAFVQSWKTAESAEAERIVQAQRLMLEVRVADELLKSISERCLSAGVEGLRADLTICRAACAWAAYQGRTAVEEDDVEAVAELALGHRRTRPPQPPPPPDGDGRENDRTERRSSNGSRGEPGRQSATVSGELRFPIEGLFLPQVEPAVSRLAQTMLSGRWRTTAIQRQGPAEGAPHPQREPGARLAWSSTLRAAAPWQHNRQRSRELLVLEANDLRFRPARRPAGCLLLFVVDASGSMAAWQRMKRTKAAIWSLLVRSHQKRDQVALLAFRGNGTELVLPPRRSLASARRAVESLAVGGTTPLAHGLAAATRFVRLQRRRQPRLPIWTILLSDGRANVPLQADPWRDAVTEARKLAEFDTEVLVVDTETGWPRFGKAKRLAEAMSADYLPLEAVLGRALAPPGGRVA